VVDKFVHNPLVFHKFLFTDSLWRYQDNLRYFDLNINIYIYICMYINVCIWFIGIYSCAQKKIFKSIQIINLLFFVQKKKLENRFILVVCLILIGHFL